MAATLKNVEPSGFCCLPQLKVRFSGTTGTLIYCKSDGLLPDHALGLINLKVGF